MTAYDIAYSNDQELPSLAIPWADSTGTLIDFSTGDWTFAVILTPLNAPATSVLVKTTGITGSAGPTTNVLVDWSVGDWAGIPVDLEGTFYKVHVRATQAGKDRYYRKGNELVLKLFQAPGTSAAAPSSLPISVTAKSVSIVDTGNYFAATNVEDALQEHLADTVDAHDATAISFVPTGTIAATDVQAAIAEVATDYLAADALLASKARTNGQRFLPTAALAQTTSRSDAISNISPLSSGRLSFHLIWLPAGTYNSITFVSANTAATTPTNQWFAIYDASTRAKLAVTADDTSTAWAANTAKTLTISGGVTLTEGAYYVGIMVAAAVVPTLYGVSTSASSAVNNLPPIVTGADTTNVGLTTPATAPATAAALTGSTLAPYAYVS